MANEQDKSKTRRDKMSVINNPNYKKNKVESKSWRKAAEIFNQSDSKRTVEDAKKELKKLRKECQEDE
jgi:hypothetical protein